MERGAVVGRFRVGQQGLWVVSSAASQERLQRNEVGHWGSGRQRLDQMTVHLCPPLGPLVPVTFDRFL